MKKESKKKVTIEKIATLITESRESLARMVANGFSDQEKKLTEKIEGGETRLGQQISGLGNRIDKLVDDKVSWTDHKRLADRVSRLEMATHAKK